MESHCAAADGGSPTTTTNSVPPSPNSSATLLQGTLREHLPGATDATNGWALGYFAIRMGLLIRYENAAFSRRKEVLHIRGSTVALPRDSSSPSQQLTFTLDGPFCLRRCEFQAETQAEGWAWVEALKKAAAGYNPDEHPDHLEALEECEQLCALLRKERDLCNHYGAELGEARMIRDEALALSRDLQRTVDDLRNELDLLRKANPRGHLGESADSASGESPVAASLRIQLGLAEATVMEQAGKLADAEERCNQLQFALEQERKRSTQQEQVQALPRQSEGAVRREALANNERQMWDRLLKEEHHQRIQIALELARERARCERLELKLSSCKRNVLFADEVMMESPKAQQQLQSQQRCSPMQSSPAAPSPSSWIDRNLASSDLSPSVGVGEEYDFRAGSPQPPLPPPPPPPHTTDEPTVLPDRIVGGNHTPTPVDNCRSHPTPSSRGAPTNPTITSPPPSHHPHTSRDPLTSSSGLHPAMVITPSILRSSSRNEAFSVSYGYSRRGYHRSSPGTGNTPAAPAFADIVSSATPATAAAGAAPSVGNGTAAAKSVSSARSTTGRASPAAHRGSYPLHYVTPRRSQSQTLVGSRLGSSRPKAAASPTPKK